MLEGRSRDVDTGTSVLASEKHKLVLYSFCLRILDWDSHTGRFDGHLDIVVCLDLNQGFDVVQEVLEIAID